MELLPAPPNIVGYIWRQYDDGSFYLPERSLGREVIYWMHRYLKMPGGKFAGEAFVPTREQARFILWWYAIDENGDWIFNRGVLRRLKGWGKDPIAAALSLAELCGPTRFSHFDDYGNPVGKKWFAAWVQVAAVSQDQTKNTFGLFPIMISKNMKADYGLEINKTLIRTEEGGLLEAVTSSPASMEGNRPTFAIQNEIQNWTDEHQGPKMAGVIQGNLDKTYGARPLSICNAHVPGTESIGELYWDNFQKIQSGEIRDEVGWFYDSIEAPVGTPGPVEIALTYRDGTEEEYQGALERLREGIRVARGDATWLNVEQIAKACLDRTQLPTELRRKFYNQVNAAEDAWIAYWDWDDIENKNLALKPKDRICLGFDGSKSNDHSALAACRVEDGAVFLIKTWDPAKYKNHEVPREDVDSWVKQCFETYDVVGFRADVKEFEAYVDIWSRDYKKKLKVNASPNNIVAFDMRGQTKRFSLDCEDFHDNVLAKTLTHNGDELLRRYVLNAHAYVTQYDTISIKKSQKDSPRKIDGAVSAVLAWGSRKDYLMSKKYNSGKAWVMR